MKKRNFLPLMASLVMSLAVAASPFPMTLTHDRSAQPVTFTKTPTRVISLSEEETELLAVLGIQPVGFASGKVQGTLGKPATNLTTPARAVLQNSVFIGSFNQPSQELLASLKPDLILMPGAEVMKPTYEAVQKFAPTLAYDYDLHSWRNPLTDMGKLFGKTAQAARYLKNFDGRVATLKQQLAPVSAKPRTTLLFMPGPQNLAVLGTDFAFSKNLSLLGFKLTVPDGMNVQTGFTPIDAEMLLKLKTDRIVVLRRTKAKAAADAMFQRLQATGTPVFTYWLDPQEATSGPLTDLKRLEGLAKLVRQ